MLDARLFSGCNFPFDHKLVVSKLRVKLKAHRKLITNTKYDTNLLKSEVIRVQYQTILSGKLSALASRKDIDSEGRWTNFKNVVNETARELIGQARQTMDK